MWRLAVLLGAWAGLAWAAEPAKFDVVVVGGTPGGLTAAIAAARGGCSVVVLERTSHIGGLPANGLGATDIHTRGATGGLFRTFVQRNLAHYTSTYGADSPQVKAASAGYHFEPQVAAQTLNAMLGEHKSITVKLQRQFDAEPTNVVVTNGALSEITLTDRMTGQAERYAGTVFIDATYEGDLAAAAGVPYRVDREGRDEFQEAMAGRLYKYWGGAVAPGSTGQADNAIQAYNYRLCLTNNPANRVPIAKPEVYDRREFAELATDIRQNRHTGTPDAKKPRTERHWDGIGRVLNPVSVPNDKVDANNQHLNFISSDLPEENWPWPTSSWAWRDRFAARLRSYTLGLVWFAQNDEAMPEAVRTKAAEWGLCKDEFADNGHFPRQVYVREGRRIIGEYYFTAKDAVPTMPGARPTLHTNSITASHYALDSHAVRKREPGRVHLDGFFSSPTKPYTVPFGVIVPTQVDGLLTPVPVSGSHIGFSTLRMEPCWMALGEAAGTAAALAVERKLAVRKVPIDELQLRLLEKDAVLIYFEDVPLGATYAPAVQYLALRGVLPTTEWKIKPTAAATAADVTAWARATNQPVPTAFVADKTTRAEAWQLLFAAIRGRK
jgi:hypothetical protein